MHVRELANNQNNELLYITISVNIILINKYF